MVERNNCNQHSAVTHICNPNTCTPEWKEETEKFSGFHMHGMAHVHLHLHMRHAYTYVKIKFFLRLFCLETESYYVDLPAAASQTLGLKACPTMPSKTMRF